MPSTFPIRACWLAPILIGTFMLTAAAIAETQSPSPHLSSAGRDAQLVVDGLPFLVLGGELGNSSASSASYMEPIWPRLKAAKLNTVLAPVYWELTEPQEGQFDFSSVDRLIDGARRHDLKLVLLWFGAWKNSMSTYVPAWVKTDQERFPRAVDEQGISQEILSPFAAANLQADKTAFVRLMQHLRATDEQNQTVILVQVENEIGMLPSARDHHPLANDAIRSPVPAELSTYLEANKGSLAPELELLWAQSGNQISGDWAAVFGQDARAEEIFMAWHYARFANQLAKSGKQAYPLPMYVNAALNRPGREPGSGYPSAGPLPHLVDIWKAGAPEIDFLAPDFYTTRFEHWGDLYARRDNPLFVPEHQFDATAAAKALFATGHYGALGFAPFSIESGSTANLANLSSVYELLRQLAPEIDKKDNQHRVDAVLLDKSNQETVLQMGRYRITCRHDFTLGWSPDSTAEEWPTVSALVVQTSENEFLVAGTGVVMTVLLDDATAGKAGILQLEEGRFDSGRFVPGRRLNGDQTHQGRHLRIPVGSYDIQRLELYVYR